MRFSTKASASYPRLGIIKEISGFPGVEFRTPNCLLFTKFGAVPFLTNDIVADIKHIPTVTFAALNFLREKYAVFEKFGKGLAEFSGLKNYPVLLFQNDPTEAPVTRAVERSSISIWAVGGRLPVTMPQYANCVVNAVPAGFQAPVDNETSFPDLYPPARKRCQKAVERTNGYLEEISLLSQKNDKLKKIPLLFSITGGNDIDQRLRGIAKIDFTKASGVILDGFFMNRLDESGKPVTRSSGDGQQDLLIDQVFEVVTQVCHQLPPDLPRFLTGVWEPDDVVRAVYSGIDFFDGSLPFRLSRSGLAWIYPTVEKDQQPWIQFPLPESDLSRNIFQQPIQPGDCDCFACQRHTCVYISHLHSVNEMLAQVLLMIHNSTRCYQFFTDLRSALEKGEMEGFKESIRSHHFPEELLKFDLTANSFRDDVDDAA